MKIPLPFLKQIFPFTISQSSIIIMMLLFMGFSGSNVFAQSCSASQVHFYSPVLGVDQTLTVNHNPYKKILLKSFTPSGGSLGEESGELTRNISYQSSNHTIATISEADGEFYLVTQGVGTSTIAVHYDDDPADCKTIFTLKVLPRVIQPGSGNILYVDQNVNGGNQSGDSWGNAIGELREAMVWAANEWDDTNDGSLQIWVAKGKYLPTNDPTDRNAAFQLLSGVEIYGGFDATEISIEDRDWQQNVTILSGDIDNNDTDVEGVITDPQTQILGNNSYHVAIGWNVGTDALLDGVTITAGLASGSQYSTNSSFGNSEGAGMLIKGPSPTLAHIVFRGNYANLGGGGLTVFGISNPTITGSQFINNLSNAVGGGIFASHSNLTLFNSTLIKNKAEFGGGISSGSSTLTLTNSTVSGNTVSSDGGGIWGNYGTVMLINSILSGNTAEGMGNQLYNELRMDEGVTSLSHSLYTNDTNDVVNIDDVGNSIALNTTEVIHADPQFADPDNGNYSLLLTSPAINAGSNALLENIIGPLSGTEVDLAGNARVYNYDSGGEIDMGAYEFQGDLPPAVVTNVAVPSNGTYGYGENLDFIVNYDKNIMVDTTGGTPELALIIGETTRYADYISGSGTTALLFRYTVQDDDLDTDGISAGTAIALNGSILQDTDGTNASLALSGIASTSGVLVDAIAPSGYSVSIDQHPINAANQSAVSFTFAGAEVGTTYNFTLSDSEGGSDVTGSGTITSATDQITGIALNGLAEGIITLSVTLTDAVGNTGLVATNTSIKNINSAPAVTGVSIAGTLTVGAPLTGDYTFSDPDGDMETGTSYKWYRANDVTGTDKTVISGAVSDHYTLQTADRGKYISFEVTPNDGISTGAAEESSLVGPVKIDQHISFSGISSKTYGDPLFTLGDAQSDQGLPITYTATDPSLVSISGNQATLLGAGTTTITATQEGDDQTNAAGDVQQTLTVNKSPLTITTDEVSKVYGSSDPPLSYRATGFVNGDTLSLLAGNLSRDSGEDVGSYPITLGNLSAGANYTLEFEPSDFEILKAPQQLSWDQDLSFGCGSNSQISLTASSDSGLPVTYTVTDASIAEVKGTVLTHKQSGTTTIIATQLGDKNHHPASSVEKTLLISQGGLIRQHWEDVLVFDNSGGSFTGYQWYKNGTAIPGATAQYYSESGGFNGSYYVRASTESGEVITSCPLDLSGESTAKKVTLVPNPVLVASEFTLENNFEAVLLNGASISIIDLNGRVVGTVPATGSETKLKAPMQTGIYVISLSLSDGTRKTVNLLVK